MTTLKTANPKLDLPSLLSGSQDLSIAVAYVTRDGFLAIKEHLLSVLELGRRVRVMLDLQSGNTDPSALWDLLGLAELHESLLLKTIVPSSKRGILHSKLFISHGRGDMAFLTGSANLTGAALNKNLEHCLLVEGTPTDPEMTAVLGVFEEFWSDPQAKTLDEEAARLYELYCGRLRRSQRRAQSSWSALVEHLETTDRQPFSWPSVEAAYLMGVIAARGRLLPDRDLIEVKLGFSPANYTDRTIKVRDVSYPADEVLPQIPVAIASRVKKVLPDASLQVSKRRVAIDVSACSAAMEIILDAYKPYLDTENFRLPNYLTSARVEIVLEFLRGFAVACALVTDGTSLPSRGQAGDKGQMMVWLRPKQGNERLFDSLRSLIVDRLGIAVYVHKRKERESHLKIHCENFQQIGFGLDWWDELVEAGAQYNQELFE